VIDGVLACLTIEIDHDMAWCDISMIPTGRRITLTEGLTADVSIGTAGVGDDVAGALADMVSLVEGIGGNSPDTRLIVDAVRAFQRIDPAFWSEHFPVITTDRTRGVR